MNLERPPFADNPVSDALVARIPRSESSKPTHDKFVNFTEYKKYSHQGPEYIRAANRYKEALVRYIRYELDSGRSIEDLRRFALNKPDDQGEEQRRAEEAKKAFYEENVKLFNVFGDDNIFDATLDEVIAEKNPEIETSPAQEATALERTQPSLDVERPKEMDPTLREHFIQTYLSYQDADISDDARKQAFQYSQESESAGKYAESLRDLSEKYNLEDIRRSSRQMIAECKSVLEQYGITPSSYVSSETWSMWDMAKQYY
ncbi:MAG: hypothetical protein WBB68_03175, partial [Candidatus Moraniibacteriota bacterium]